MSANATAIVRLERALSQCPGFRHLPGHSIGHLIGMSAIAIALAVPFRSFLARLSHYGYIELLL
jgi:hypothetical protein